MLFDATGVKVRTNAEWAADKQHSDLLQTGGRQGYSRNIYDPNVTLREAIENERLAETNASQARVLVAQKYGQGSMNDLNKLNSVVLGKPEVQYDSSTGTWCTIDGVSGEKFASFDSKKAAEHALKEWDDQSQEDQPMDGKEDRYSKELIPTAPQASMGRRAESGYQEGLGAVVKTAKAIGAKRTAKAIGTIAKDSGSAALKSAGSAMASHPRSTVAAAGATGVGAGGLAVNKLKKQESWRDPYIQELLEAVGDKIPGGTMKRRSVSEKNHVGPEIPNSPKKGYVGPEIPDSPSKKSSIGLSGGPEQKAAVGHATSKPTSVPFSKTGFKPGTPTSFLKKAPMSLGKKVAGALAVGSAVGGAAALMRRKKEGDDGELLFDEDGEVSGDEELLEAYLRERANDDYPGDTKGPRVEPKTKGPRMFQPSEENAYKQPANARMQAVDHQAGPVPVGGKPKISVVDHHAGPVPYGKPGMGVAGKGMLGLVALGFTAAAIKKAHDAYKEEHGEAPSEEELHHQLKKG